MTALGLLAAIVLVGVVAALVAVPWLGRTRASGAAARAMRDRLGAPVRRASGLEPGVATVAGRLVADETVQRMEGGPCALSVARSAVDGGLAIRRAEGLALEVDGARVAIEGHLDLLAGTHECWARLVSGDAAKQLFAASGAGDRDTARAWDLRSLSLEAGDEVIARGELVRVAGSDDAAYRDGASDWVMRPTEHTGVELAAARPPRVAKLGRRQVARRSLVIGAIVFAALPYGLGKLGQSRRATGSDRLRDCDASGVSYMAQADFVHAAQALFPGWRPHAINRRADVLSRAANGTRVCQYEVPPDDDVVVETLAFIDERLPEVTDASDYDFTAGYTEELLHVAGRDRELVALARRLPPGGNVRQRVTAHLYLGDVAGAADAWREPDAHVGGYDFLFGISRAFVLCLDEDYEAADAAFEEALVAFDAEEANVPMPHRPLQLRAYRAECALRAGDLESARAVAAEMQELETRGGGLGDRSARVRAELAIRAGEPVRAIETLAPFRNDGGGSHLTTVWLLVQLDRVQDALDTFERGQLAYFTSPGISRQVQIFDNYRVPMLDETRLRETLERLAPREDEAARELAAKLYGLLAVQLGRRWDPEADTMFDEALARRPDDPWLRLMRSRMAFFHGEGELSEGDPLLDPDQHPQTEGPPERAVRDDIAIGGLSARARTVHGIRRLHAMSVSDGAKLEVLRTQEQNTTWPGVFFRLTNLIVHGRRLGADTTAWEEQLEALRAFVDAQPNAVLLQEDV